jgi:tetratricopeptide (TPR) repeat protein
MAALEAQAKALQNAIERDPLNAAAFNELGNVLSQLGRPDEAIAAYDREELAVTLARDPQRMAAIKQRLAANLPAAPLFDSRRHVAALEAAYVRMYQRQANGLPPADFTI